MIGAMAAMVTGAFWLFRIVPTLVHRRSRLTAREWARWLLVPIVLVGAYLSMLSPIPFELRLAASRGAMDEAAQALLADGPGVRLDRLVPGRRIDRVDRGVRFLIAGSGFLDPIGFAYTTDGEPPIIGEDIYEHAGGNWWHWQESW